jgi:hypothetical protein
LFTGKQVDFERADFENIGNKKSLFPFYNIDFDPIGLQILLPDGPLGKHTFASIFIGTLLELITFSLST